MEQIKTSVIITSTPEKVFTFVTDFNNDVQWWKEVIESRQIAGDGPGVGARYWQSSQMLGYRSETTLEMTEYEPYRKAVLETLSGPLAYTATFTFEPVDGGTRLTFGADVHIKGLFQIAVPVLGSALKHMTSNNFGYLKTLLEADT